MYDARNEYCTDIEYGRDEKEKEIRKVARVDNEARVSCSSAGELAESCVHLVGCDASECRRTGGWLVHGVTGRALVSNRAS